MPQTHRMHACPGCGKDIRLRSEQCADCRYKKPGATAAETVRHDIDQRAVKQSTSMLQQKYAEAIKTIERLESQVGAMDVLGKGVETFKIVPHHGSGTSEATPVLVASDWHVEERVGPEVGRLNRYDLDIAKERATRFFRAGHRLIDLLSQDVKIETVVLALLGDFITNDIHAELNDLTALQPVHALTFAQGLIISGIEFLLDNTKYNFVVPCHSGNHARTTLKTHFSAENGHSLEYLMYLHLAAYFRSEPRVQFIIPDGYHSYLNVYDQTIRFHHGHAIKYAGGVGGIYIPVNKSISQWNKAQAADLDVFGHFHQVRDGGNFLTNGSLIGYNAFALSIKADFEKARQLLFLMDKKRGRTCTWPVLV